MEDTWTTRDYPVLKAAVELQQDGHRSVSLEEIAVYTDLPTTEVRNSLEQFKHAQPPYFVQITGSLAGVDGVHGLTERAMVRAGYWPSESDGIATLISALQAASESEPDSPRRGKLRRAAEALADVGVDFAAKTTAEFLKGRFG